MKTRKRMISLLVAAALLFTAVLPAGAVTQSDIQAIKNQLSSVTARKKEAEEQLAAIRGDLSRAQEQVELVQEQVLLTEQQVSAGREILARYDAQIQEKQREIAELEARLAACGREMEAAATDYAALERLTAEQAALTARLDEKMERWLYLNELAERIEAQKG